MTSQKKIEQLSSILYEQLTPLVDRDYVLYGYPNYTNIGDTLIWDGELEFLKRIPHKCVGTCFWNEYPNKPLDKDIIVLITGGGYFGDMWRDGWNNVLQGLSHLKDNRIIILPNSIHYNDPRLLEEDVNYLKGFKELIICARDSWSFEFAKKHFENKIMLLPDMAFCINTDALKKWIVPVTKNILYLKRNDKEFVAETGLKENEGIDIHDWPTMESTSLFQKNIDRCDRYLMRFGRRHLIPKFLENAGRKYIYENLFRKYLTAIGVKFISQYKIIVTTRLHCMILGVLLGKEVEFIDNSYHKLGNFYSTWLSDCETVNEH